MPIEKGFILKHIGNDYMIIPTTSNNVRFDKIFNLNETSAYIYERLNEGKNIEEIIDLMSNEYNAPKDVITKDVYEFVEELKKRGIYKD
jgi:hypothetical protein